jgi:hypothetical protein
LTIEVSYSEYVQDWAVRRIRRETWALQAGQQTIRSETLPLKENVQNAFRRLPEKFDELPDLLDEIRNLQG